MLKLFSKFSSKPTLRELCIKEYGNNFADDYDKINNGNPVGSFSQTALVVDMVERVKVLHQGQYK